MMFFRKITGSRTFKLCFIIVIQILLVFCTIKYASNTALFYNMALFINFLLGISILSKDDLNPVYKLMWICVLSMLPIIGTAIYLLWGDRKLSKRTAKRMDISKAKIEELYKAYSENFKDPDILSGGEKASARYLLGNADAPVFGDTAAEYFSCGEAFFERFLEELENAERFIFMEYFIIKDGEMWNRVFDVLKRKASEGVDIRLIFDAMGSLFHLPDDFIEINTQAGIKCYKFNPIHFTVYIPDYTFLNHRDHRKICVIDGNIGFTGGINLADEYINKNCKLGYWKDTAIMLKGPGVFSLTVTFLRTWSYVSKDESVNYKPYLPTIQQEADFYVQPYEDSPMDVENVSENCYFNVIYHARKYVYITTPYLIIDNEMITTLSLSAKSGVDVRIVVPGVPDKKYAYYITQSFYPELLRSGVRIFEYTPGFVHAKMFIRDDEQAIVGTANLDYRSLYLHFENCCQFYGGHIVKDIKADFDEMLQASREITMEDIKKTPKIKRIIQLILKFFAPIM